MNDERKMPWTTEIDLYMPWLLPVWNRIVHKNPAMLEMAAGRTVLTDTY